MEMKIRIATFNCENLFGRFKFKKGIDPEKAQKDGWIVDKTKFDLYKPEEKKLTALAIKAAKADVIALQEIESMEALRRFRSKYLGGRKKYPYILVIDGNDPRKIDVGVLSKYKIERIRTYVNRYDPKRRSYFFARDCLECDVVISKNAKITLFINHFKSMMDKKKPCKGRQATHAKRKVQADEVKKIVSKWMKNNKGNFAILGDFNDYLESDAQGKSAILQLINWNKVENVVKRLPVKERWTHYYKGKKSKGKTCIPESYKQIDYILVSKPLANKNRNVIPEIIRKGTPERVKRYTGKRFPGIGYNSPKSSDHCPVVIELEL